MWAAFGRIAERRGTDHTSVSRFRIPKPMWTAFMRVTQRLGTNRTARLLEHIRADIHRYRAEAELAEFAQAEHELAERRARTGGRPRTAR